MSLEGRDGLRRATAALSWAVIVLSLSLACIDSQPAEVEVERTVEVVKEVEVPVEIEVERTVEVVKEVEVPVEIEVERTVEVVKEVEVPVEVEVERVVEIVKEVEVPVEVEVERVVEIVKEVEVPVEVEVERVVEVVRLVRLTDLLIPGLWVADLVAEPGQTDVSAPWFAARISHGQDPYEDPWRLDGGPLSGPSSFCDLRHRTDGWELSSCDGFVHLDVQIFVPAGGTDVEVTVSSPEFVARGILTRVVQRGGPQASDNVEVLWHQPGEYLHSDIWAEGDLVFAPRYDGEIEIIAADNGRLVGNASAPGPVFDVKARDGILYAATPFNGIQIFDISDPVRPRHIGEFFAEGVSNFHNIYLSPDGRLLYAINNSEYPETDLLAVDVSNPLRPIEAGRFSIKTDTATSFNFHDTHDVNVIEVDGRLIAFLNYLAAGLWILDVTDPQNMTALGTIRWGRIFSHSGWPFWVGGKLYYAHNSEGYDSHMTILDVTDLTDPRVVSRFATRKGISIHNVEVVEGVAYISYYVDGLRVVDLRDPRRPKEIAHFDTVSDANERDILQGAWGVRVLDGTVYVSDIERGIYAFRVKVD